MNKEDFHDPVAELARQIFSAPYLYPVQRYAIANILDGINQIVILPTGSGKSLCFQLPAVILNGLTLIVVPLLSLMADQMRRFEEREIPCCCLKGDQTEEERTGILEKLKSGSMKIVFTTPESLCSGKLDSFFGSVEISHLVIDEAHCVTEWGNTFRPAYLSIGDFIKTGDIKCITAFTATASGNVLNSIRESLFGDLPVISLVENPDRVNISYEVIPVLSKSRTVTRLVADRDSPVLIFTRSRKRTEYYARLLKNRFPSREIYFYHAGLNKEERQAVEKWFMQASGGLLVATAAFGLGIDKADIRTVIHADVPYSIEAYLQESGRAGRDKKASTAILLHSREDALFGDKLENTILKSRYGNLLKYTQKTDVCRREILLECMGYELDTECSGCDVCTGSSVSREDGRNELLDFFKKYRRQFSIREAVQVLQGRQTFDVVSRELDKCRDFGLLADWEKEDIEEGIECLLEEGALKVPGKGFWKYRITAGKRQSS